MKAPNKALQATSKTLSVFASPELSRLSTTMKHGTRLALAIIRNNLYNGRFGEPDKSTLAEVTETIKPSHTPFRQVMLQAIANATSDIEMKRLTQAGYELNAIHNLPVEEDDFSSWDKNWFYNAEVPSYIEQVGNGARGKAFLILVEETKVVL